MVNYNPKSWITLIFALHKSDTLRMLWKEIIYLGFFTLIIAFLVINYFPNSQVLEKLFSVYSLVGFVISLLLVFRTNTAYERWWEGRKKWGELVNDTRNLSIKLNSILANNDDKIYFNRMIINFVFAMKEHLRNGVIWEELNLSELEKSELKTKKHVPLALASLMYLKLDQLRKDKIISKEMNWIIDKNLNSLMDICGSCERIKKTPIPFSYSLFIKKFIFIYVITLPLAFVPAFGYYSALIATFVFYVLVSMEVLAEEIEDPFGSDDNDLPTDDLCKTMKINILECFNLEK